MPPRVSFCFIDPCLSRLRFLLLLFSHHCPLLAYILAFPGSSPTHPSGFCFIDHSLVSSLFLSGAGVALLLQLLLLFWPGMALSWLTRLASSTTTTLRTLSERCTDYCVGCIVTGGSLPLAMCLCKKYMGRMDMGHEAAYRQQTGYSFPYE